ncbi:glycosyltransferase [Actinoplanes sp. N902-109]|uniref:glycosyltransferase n=1 Tax=Actinoplanes sp. (strain N902-109) TaxID=649831 RepID=UPI0003295304|nr:glycosyltransferase [Actinoplanes sp. N902-109]AGL18690.1 glycosyl transferase family protein [Actinoplanes sp. N902-109]
MRVLIVTSGSMGDVAPFTGLGLRLRQAGHEVTLAAHESFRAGVELPFLPLPGDVRAILPQTRAGGGPRSLLRLLTLARPLIAELGDGIAAAVRDSRAEVVLLSTMVAPLGYSVAEAAGIPWAGVFLQPVLPTGAFGPVLTGGTDTGVPAVNRLLGRFMEASSTPLYRGPIRELRARLGLPGRSNRQLQREQRHRFPTFHGFSPHVVARPPDWPASHEVVGYWWPARPAGWQPPAEVAAFLAAGPPPVVIGFGSMATGANDRLARLVPAAVRRAGVRAIVQAGWSGLRVGEHPGILQTGPLPHDWLFPRTAAVVHHAGAGTTAAALRAGVPAVAVPVLADQPFWARRLADLGVSPAPIPLPRLTAERLAGAITAALTKRDRAARLATRIAGEDGAARILEWLEDPGRRPTGLSAP